METANVPKLASVKRKNHEEILGEIDRFEAIIDDIDNFISKISGGPISGDKGISEISCLSLSEFLNSSTERMSNLNNRLSGQIDELNSKLF